MSATVADAASLFGSECVGSTFLGYPWGIDNCLTFFSWLIPMQSLILRSVARSGRLDRGSALPT